MARSRGLSLTEKVYRDLATRIRTCDLRPGEMIFEAELAARYGVSKTPVREALLRLVDEGVVEKYARAGYVVKPIGIKDVIDGYHVRALLEGEAAALAARTINDEELAELQELVPVDRKEDGSPVPPDGNRSFHLIIAHATRNQRLAKMVRVVYDDLLRVTLMDPFLTTATEGGWAEHRRIFEALRSRDARAARAAAIAHVDAGRVRALRSLSREKQELADIASVTGGSLP